ncbi:MAG: hypothetical protein KYX68_13810 [Flavobacterium sp.]|nr:hypothetical protein [Flavobacterium sp.]
MKIKKITKIRNKNTKSEPWIELLNVNVRPGSGFFELDWNDKFIHMLTQHGYQGQTDEEIVNRWFLDFETQRLGIYNLENKFQSQWYFNKDVPLNKFSDEYIPGELCNIVHRNKDIARLLKYFVDKFSSLTPNIENNISEINKELKYSGKINSYFTDFIKDNKEKKSLPICLVLPTQPIGYLYLKSAEIVDTDFLWQKELIEIENYLNRNPIPALRLANLVHNVLNVYNLKDIKKIPKFIVRDWYKKDFLTSIEQTYNYKIYQTIKNHKFWNNQNVYLFPMESFFSYELLKSNLKELSTHFNLQLDWNREIELKKEYQLGLTLDEALIQIIEVQKILEAIKNKENYNIIDLNVINEAYIYAELEKTYNFTTMPLTNTFYKNTNEIIEYLKFYPNHYKAMNPNLPTFNGIPNPFHLYKKEK